MNTNDHPKAEIECDCHVPTEKTIFEMQAEINDSSIRCNEFLQLNQKEFLRFGLLSDYDCQVFWACMDVFVATGENYFPNYSVLKHPHYYDFSQGIKHWFSSSLKNHQRFSVEQDYYDLVNWLHFFGIKYYFGIPISEFEEALTRVPVLCSSAQDKHKEELDTRRSEEIQQAIDKYFNFEGFSNPEFNSLLNDLILKQSKSRSINELLTYSKTYPEDTYIVVLKNSKNICLIGKTTEPLAFIGTRHKKLNADSACIDVVNPYYADDLVFSLKVFYGILDLSKNSVLNSGNKKYGTLKRAVFAYSRSERIPRKRIMKVIEQNGLRTIELNNGSIVIDKIELHNALFRKPGT